MIDDDDFDKPLYAGDSSEDEGPPRGDIQPSTFKTSNPTTSKAAPAVYLKPSKVLDLHTFQWTSHAAAH